MEKETLYDIIMSRLPQDGFSELAYSKHDSAQVWTGKKGLSFPGSPDKKEFSSVKITGSGIDAVVEIHWIRTIHRDGDPLSETATHRYTSKITYDPQIRFYENGGKEGNTRIFKPGIRSTDSCDELTHGDYSNHFPMWVVDDESVWQYVLTRLANELKSRVN